MAVSVLNTWEFGDRTDSFGAGGAGAQFTLPGAVSAGSRLVLVAAGDGYTEMSVNPTDNLAQTWTLRATSSDAPFGGAACAVWDVTTAADASLDIDLNVDSSNNHFYMVTVWELSASAFQTVGTATGGAFNTSFDLGTSSAAAHTGDIGLAWVAEPFDGALVMTSPSGATDVALTGNSKARSHATTSLTAAGTFHPVGTISGGLGTWAGAWIIYEDSAPPPSAGDNPPRRRPPLTFR